MHRPARSRSSPGSGSARESAGRPPFDQLGHPRQDRGRSPCRTDAPPSPAPRRGRRTRRRRRGRRRRAPRSCSGAMYPGVPSASPLRSAAWTTVASPGWPDPREAEVEDLDLPVVAPDDVLRFQIAMDDAVFVRGGERGRDRRRACGRSWSGGSGPSRSSSRSVDPAPAPRRCTARRRSPRARRPWRWPDARAPPRPGLRA